MNRKLGAITKELREKNEELVQKETALRESEERYRLAINSAHLGTFDINLKTGETILDGKVKEIFGVDNHVVFSFDEFLECVHLGDRDVIRPAVAEILDPRRGGNCDQEFRVVRPDGTETWVRVFGKMYFEGEGNDRKAVRLVGVIQDITDQKETHKALMSAREDLQNNKEYLENIFEAIPLALVLIEKREKKILSMNKRAKSLYGMDYTGLDLDGYDEKIHAAQVDGSPYPRKKMPVCQSMATGKEVHDVEMIIDRPDGAKMPIKMSSAPLFDSHGKVTGGVVVFDDISEKKQVEEDLLEKNRKLTAAYEDLSIRKTELNQMVEVLTQRERQLQVALSEKEILLSEIHHRVKNNLTAFISLLGLEGTTEDTPAGRELRRDLQNRARSMALIHEILYKTQNYDAIDLEVYLTNLVGQISQSLQTHREVKISVETFGIFIDLPRATPVGLIVNELVTNSFKYAFPDSFDALSHRGAPPRIKVVFIQHEGNYALSVGDNGVGLPMGFDITHSKTLGLKLVNFLARHQLGASIDVNTTGGTEFVFRFKKKIV